MPRTDDWDENRIPRLDGKTAVVTGASSGAGLETARHLAARGATVVLACRDDAKADAAAATIAGDVATVHLDLTSLASVRAAAAELHARYAGLDLLVNNAGVMWAPQGRTEDGFELHMGTNHLGHFAFTGLVLDLLRKARVVTVASPAHRRADLPLDDLRSERRYRPMRAYGRSKLANLLFTYELQRRSERANADLTALAAHPGGARSELNRTMPVLFRGPSWGLARPITHSASVGALSIVRAAVDPDARGGQYYGPDGFGEFRGRPTLLTPADRARDEDLARGLWEASEQLTGVTYSL